MSKVVPIFTGKDPDWILDQARGEFEGVLVIGIDFCGELDLRASTNLNRAQLNFYIDQAKAMILSLKEDE